MLFLWLLIQAFLKFSVKQILAIIWVSGHLAALPVFYFRKQFSCPFKMLLFFMCKFSWYLWLTLSKSGFTVSFCFVTKIYLPVNTGTCSNFELMRILLMIWIAVLVHLVELRMNSLSVLFWDGSLSSYILRKLFKFWQYFLIKFPIQEANFSPHQRRQLLDLVLVLFLFDIWISDCLCLAHILKIRLK